MSPHIDTLSYSNFQRTSAARLLDSTQRQQIALGAINPKTHLKHLAEHHGVSRKFIYRPLSKLRFCRFWSSFESKIDQNNPKNR